MPTIQILEECAGELCKGEWVSLLIFTTKTIFYL